MIVAKSIEFDAAHYLPNYNGKCSRMHGHRWRVEVAFEGPIQTNGMVVDFIDVKRFLEHIEDELDHQVVNDTITNPTAENICLYIKDTFESDDWGIHCRLRWIKVWESSDSYAMWEPDDTVKIGKPIFDKIAIGSRI